MGFARVLLQVLKEVGEGAGAAKFGGGDDERSTGGLLGVGLELAKSNALASVVGTDQDKYICGIK